MHLIMSTTLLKRYRRLLFSTPRDGPWSEDPPPGLNIPPSPGLSPPRVQENREALALIEEFIAWLPDEYTRQAILLHYARGYKWVAVAQKLGGATDESLQQLVYTCIRQFNNR